MTNSINTLVLTQSPMPESLIEKLRAVSPRLHVEHRTAQKIDELGDALSSVEVLYTTQLLPTPEQAPRLRWVQCHFAGVNHLINSPLINKVTLTTSSGVHVPVMAEYVVLMMLAFSHRLPRMIEHQHAIKWSDDRWKLFAPRELRDCVLGIIGYGSIGREVARVAKAFGMRVLATKRDTDQTIDHGWHLPNVGDPEGTSVDQMYSPKDLYAMLGESDFVLVAVPFTAETKLLVNAEALRAMKKDAVLINVARGGIVDEEALANALRENRLGGAALDVFAQEPLPKESPLWTAPNMIISPHVSGFTLRYDERVMSLFAENLRRYVNGENLLNVVDVSKGY